MNKMILIIYTAHILGWVVLVGLRSVITGRPSLLRPSSAIVLGLMSGTLQIAINYLVHNQ